MALIANPILPGFNPDPSICRVGDDYYIATSTFEWWPGVRLYHSRDLAKWKLAGYALTRRSQIDQRGNPDSGGVWAPALSYADGKFWLCYSDVKSLQGPFKDVRNYLVTADSITGPWSERVPLTANGFDPSLFHDENGRKWVLNQQWDTREGADCFVGITLQEFDSTAQKLVGDSQLIYEGTGLGCTEGPHVYRKDGYYYLLLAEGGTGYEHAVSVVRAQNLTGPYEVSPYHPLLTALGRPELGLQKTGHGSLVEGPDGRWYMPHLCGRPQGPLRRCILGRETALQVVDWPEGEWPRLATGGNGPTDSIELPWVDEAPPQCPAFADDFSGTELGLEWNTLREPAAADWLDLGTRPGWMRLRGRYSLQSRFDQSLVGVRITSLRSAVSVVVDFEPEHYQQTAGLVFYYNTQTFHYLQIGWDEAMGRVLRIHSADTKEYHFAMKDPVSLPELGAVELHAALDQGKLRFGWSTVGGEVQSIGPELDATLLSDDHVIDSGAWGFTGCFAALCAQDATDVGPWAAFTHFRREALV